MPPRVATTPRKKPRQARSRATIDALLGATARVLLRDGFDRASTNKIAEAAGVSVGSLYQYFPSKEALVAELVERHMAEMRSVLESELARVADAPLEEAARAMVDLMLEAHAVNPRLHRVVAEQLPRIGRLDRVHALELEFTTLVRAFLERHAGDVLPEDLELAAFVLVQTVEALTHAATLHHPERLRDGRLAREITALVLRYLGHDDEPRATARRVTPRATARDVESSRRGSARGPAGRGSS